MQGRRSSGGGGDWIRAFGDASMSLDDVFDREADLGGLPAPRNHQPSANRERAYHSLNLADDDGDNARRHSRRSSESSGNRRPSNDDLSAVSAEDLARRRLMEQQKTARLRQSQRLLTNKKADDGPSLGDFLSKNRAEESDYQDDGSESDSDDGTFLSMFQWSVSDDIQKKQKKKLSSSRSVGGRSLAGGYPRSQTPSGRRMRASTSVACDTKDVLERSRNMYQKVQSEDEGAGFRSLEREFSSHLSGENLVTQVSQRRLGGLNREASDRFDQFLEQVKTKEEQEKQQCRSSTSSRRHSVSSRGDGKEHRHSSRREREQDVNDPDDPDKEHRRRKKKKDRDGERRHSSRRSSARGDEADGERRRSSRRSSHRGGLEEDGERRRSSHRISTRGDEDDQERKERRRSSRRKGETGAEGEEKQRRRRSHRHSHKGEDGDEHRRHRSSSRRSSSKHRSSRKLKNGESSRIRSHEEENVEKPPTPERKSSLVNNAIVDNNDNKDSFDRNSPDGAGEDSQWESQYESQGDYHSEPDPDEEGLKILGKFENPQESVLLLQFNPTKDGHIEQVSTKNETWVEIDHYNGRKSAGQIAKMPLDPMYGEFVLADAVTVAMSASSCFSGEGISMKNPALLFHLRSRVDSGGDPIHSENRPRSSSAGRASRRCSWGRGSTSEISSHLERSRSLGRGRRNATAYNSYVNEVGHQLGRSQIHGRLRTDDGYRSRNVLQSLSRGKIRGSSHSSHG